MISIAGSKSFTRATPVSYRVSSFFKVCSYSLCFELILGVSVHCTDTMCKKIRLNEFVQPEFATNV